MIKWIISYATLLTGLILLLWGWNPETTGGRFFLGALGLIMIAVASALLGYFSY